MDRNDKPATYRSTSPVYFDRPVHTVEPSKIIETSKEPVITSFCNSNLSNGQQVASVWHRPIPMYANKPTSSAGPVINEINEDRIDDMRKNSRTRRNRYDYSDNDLDDDSEYSDELDQLLTDEESDNMDIKEEPKNRHRDGGTGRRALITPRNYSRIRPIKLSKEKKLRILNRQRQRLERRLNSVDERLKRLNQPGISKRCVRAVGKVLKYPVYASVVCSGVAYAMTSLDMVPDNIKTASLLASFMSNVGQVTGFGTGLLATGTFSGLRYIFKKSLGFQ